MSRLRSGILIIAAMSVAVSISHAAEPFSNTKGSADASSAPPSPPLPADQFKTKVNEQSQKTHKDLQALLAEQKKMEPPPPPGSAPPKKSGNLTKMPQEQPDTDSQSSESSGAAGSVNRNSTPTMPAASATASTAPDAASTAPAAPPPPQVYSPTFTAPNNTTPTAPAKSSGNLGIKY